MSSPVVDRIRGRLETLDDSTKLLLRSGGTVAMYDSEFEAIALVQTDSDYNKFMFEIFPNVGTLEHIVEHDEYVDVEKYEEREIVYKGALIQCKHAFLELAKGDSSKCDTAFLAVEAALAY